MLRLKLSAIAVGLLGSLAASFVLPPEPASTLLEYATTTSEPASTAIPLQPYPFAVSYDAENTATIRLRIPLDESTDEEEVLITVPASVEPGCSESDVTGLSVNGQLLEANRHSIENGLTTARWASADHSSDTSALGASARASLLWSLRCACLSGPQRLLTSVDGDCPEVGYILEYRLALLGSSQFSGFSLAFVQSPQPRLLELTSLDQFRLGSDDGSVPPKAQVALLGGNFAPPYLAETGSVSTATLFQSFATSSIALSAIPTFSTITTPIIQATPTHEAETPLATSTTDVPELHLSYGGQKVLQSHTKEEEPHCAVKSFKNLVAQVQVKVKGALQFTVGELAKHRQCRGCITEAWTKHQNETRAISNGTDGLHDHDPPVVATERDDQVLRALHMTSLIVTVVVLACCIFACARRDPRKRVDRAARREERRNRRLYKRAACKLKWQSFMERVTGKLSRQNRTDIVQQVSGFDEESTWEKFSSESSLEIAHSGDAVNEEIQALRKAHGFVEGIIQGHGSVHRSHKRRSMVRHSRSYSDSLNSEKSLLPAYTEKDEVVMVDGHLCSSRVLVQLTPASSIIATSPQNSDCGSSDSEKE